MTDVVEDTPTPLDGCEAGVTAGMLVRLHYGSEPGGGWTRQTLYDHCHGCDACTAEMQELSEGDTALLERFNQEVKTNQLIAQAYASSRLMHAEVRAARESIRTALQANASDTDAQHATDHLHLLAREKTGPAEAALRQYEIALDAPDPQLKRRELEALASEAAVILQTMTEEEARGLISLSRTGRSTYPLDGPDSQLTYWLVFQLLAQAEAHLNANTPILRFRGSSVEVDWGAWREAGEVTAKATNM